MPESIKDKFVADQMRLIRGVIREIQHREHYETRSAEIVRSILTKLFTKVVRSSSRKYLVKNSKQISHHPKAGGIHA
jgi:hypothetical protein